MKTKKNILIGALLVVVVAMSVGYAAMAQQLTINGSANFEDVQWKIAFKEITLDTDNTEGATEENAPTIVGTTASFDVKLAYPGAKATYKIKVKNEGTINAYLQDISGVEEANSTVPTDIKYTVKGISVNDTLNTTEEKEFTVVVEWLDSDSISADTSKTATIYLNYVQAK